jgi:hypothetical protein
VKHILCSTDFIADSSLETSVSPLTEGHACQRCLSRSNEPLKICDNDSFIIGCLCRLSDVEAYLIHTFLETLCISNRLYLTIYSVQHYICSTNTSNNFTHTHELK